MYINKYIFNSYFMKTNNIKYFYIYIFIKVEWNKNHMKKVDNFFELKKLTKNYIGAAQANAKIQRNDEVNNYYINSIHKFIIII